MSEKKRKDGEAEKTSGQEMDRLESQDEALWDQQQLEEVCSQEPWAVCTQTSSPAISPVYSDWSVDSFRSPTFSSDISTRDRSLSEVVVSVPKLSTISLGTAQKVSRLVKQFSLENDQVASEDSEAAQHQSLPMEPSSSPSKRRPFVSLQLIKHDSRMSDNVTISVPRRDSVPGMVDYFNTFKDESGMKNSSNVYKKPKQLSSTIRVSVDKLDGLLSQSVSQESAGDRGEGNFLQNRKTGDLSEPSILSTSSIEKKTQKENSPKLKSKPRAQMAELKAKTAKYGGASPSPEISRTKSDNIICDVDQANEYIVKRRNFAGYDTEDEIAELPVEILQGGSVSAVEYSSSVSASMDISAATQSDSSPPESCSDVPHLDDNSEMSAVVEESDEKESVRSLVAEGDEKSSASQASHSEPHERYSSNSEPGSPISKANNMQGSTHSSAFSLDSESDYLNEDILMDKEIFMQNKLDSDEDSEHSELFLRLVSKSPISAITERTEESTQENEGSVSLNRVSSPHSARDESFTEKVNPVNECQFNNPKLHQSAIKECDKYEKCTSLPLQLNKYDSSQSMGASLGPEASLVQTSVSVCLPDKPPICSSQRPTITVEQSNVRLHAKPKLPALGSSSLRGRSESPPLSPVTRLNPDTIRSTLHRSASKSMHNLASGASKTRVPGLPTRAMSVSTDNLTDKGSRSRSPNSVPRGRGKRRVSGEGGSLGRRCVSAVALSEGEGQRSLHGTRSISLNKLSASRSSSLSNMVGGRRLDYSHVPSKVRQYIEDMREKDLRNSTRSLPCTPAKRTVRASTPAMVLDEQLIHNLLQYDNNEEIPNDLRRVRDELIGEKGDPGRLRELLELLVEERRARHASDTTLATLQMRYDNLNILYAEKQNEIDRLRFLRNNPGQKKISTASLAVREGQWHSGGTSPCFSPPRLLLHRTLPAQVIAPSHKASFTQLPAVSSSVAEPHFSFTSDCSEGERPAGEDHPQTTCQPGLHQPNTSRRASTSSTHSASCLDAWLKDAHNLLTRVKEFVVLEGNAALQPDQRTTTWHSILRQYWNLSSQFPMVTLVATSSQPGLLQQEAGQAIHATATRFGLKLVAEAEQCSSTCAFQPAPATLGSEQELTANSINRVVKADTCGTSHRSDAATPQDQAARTQPSPQSATLQEGGMQDRGEGECGEARVQPQAATSSPAHSRESMKTVGPLEKVKLWQESLVSPELLSPSPTSSPAPSLASPHLTEAEDSPTSLSDLQPGGQLPHSPPPSPVQAHTNRARLRVGSPTPSTGQVNYELPKSPWKSNSGTPRLVLWGRRGQGRDLDSGCPGSEPSTQVSHNASLDHPDLMEALTVTTQLQPSREEGGSSQTIGTHTQQEEYSRHTNQACSTTHLNHTNEVSFGSDLVTLAFPEVQGRDANEQESLSLSNHRNSTAPDSSQARHKTGSGEASSAQSLSQRAASPALYPSRNPPPVGSEGRPASARSTRKPRKKSGVSHSQRIKAYGQESLQRHNEAVQGDLRQHDASPLLSQHDQESDMDKLPHGRQQPSDHHKYNTRYVGLNPSDVSDASLSPQNSSSNIHDNISRLKRDLNIIKSQMLNLTSEVFHDKKKKVDRHHHGQSGGKREPVKALEASWCSEESETSLDYSWRDVSGSKSGNRHSTSLRCRSASRVTRRESNSGDRKKTHRSNEGWEEASLELSYSSSGPAAEPAKSGSRGAENYLATSTPVKSRAEQGRKRPPSPVSSRQGRTKKKGTALGKKMLLQSDLEDDHSRVSPLESAIHEARHVAVQTESRNTTLETEQPQGKLEARPPQGTHAEGTADELPRPAPPVIYIQNYNYGHELSTSEVEVSPVSQKQKRARKHCRRGSTEELLVSLHHATSLAERLRVRSQSMLVNLTLPLHPLQPVPHPLPTPSQLQPTHPPSHVPSPTSQPSPVPAPHIQLSLTPPKSPHGASATSTPVPSPNQQESTPVGTPTPSPLDDTPISPTPAPPPLPNSTTTAESQVPCSSSPHHPS